ncbi:hypothetical protein ANN_05703 [Periplaneta americana]|uniref:Uncharacterized protein n=1 Tax=Periplaneta americana TaxID=6978 RepID=A0ABQ8TCU7_PERAM|nr:hypothetical protein ANN_05703 [Periplaneta americana]
MGNACYYSVEKLLSSSVLSKNLKVRIYKTVILPVVLYGCATWTLTLRKKRRLKVFENKVLRKIFGAKRDEVTGEWRKLHNADLHALYSSPDIIRNIKSRRLRWAGHVARMGESRNAYSVLVGRPEGIRHLWRPRRRWEDNIKIELREVGYDGRDWINLAQDRDQWRAYARAAMNLRISGRQHSLKWVTGKQCIVICPVMQQEEGESMPLMHHVQSLIRGPDLAPSDYHCLMHMKKWLAFQRFDDDEELHFGVLDWLQSRAGDFHDCGIQNLRDEVTGEWRKLHNAELHALYSSPDIMRNIKSRRLRWAGHVARMGESRNAYRMLVGRPEGKIPFGRPRRGWEDNIKMDLREVDMMIENGLILHRIGTNGGLM